MTQPLSLQLIKRLSKWPALQETAVKNSLALINSSVEQTNNNCEDINDDAEESEEDNPALEGHFLSERAASDESGLNRCVCKCHEEQSTTFELTLPFSCSKCSQQFCCKCQFLVHREFHRSERKYECDTCGKTYFYKSDLVRHTPVHSQVKPHVCKVCGRSFSQVGHLITHRLIHTGEKPFACDICGKSFNRKSNLSKHKMIHTGERPFKCTTCGNRFSRKGDLQRHSVLHTGERPYKCDHCDKSFSQKPHLVTHQAVHTGERAYKCACGRSFNRKNCLLKHQIEKCAEFPIKGSDGNDVSLAEYHLSSNSFFNLNHLLATRDDETESTVEKSYFESLGFKLKMAESKNLNLNKSVETSLLRERLSDPKFARTANELKLEKSDNNEIVCKKVSGKQCSEKISGNCCERNQDESIEEAPSTEDKKQSHRNDCVNSLPDKFTKSIEADQESCSS